MSDRNGWVGEHRLPHPRVEFDDAICRVFGDALAAEFGPCEQPVAPTGGNRPQAALKMEIPISAFPSGKSATTDSAWETQLAVRFDRGRCPARRHHPESAGHVPAPRGRCLHLPRRRAPAHQRASRPPRPSSSPRAGGSRCSPTTPFAPTSVRTTTTRHHTDRRPAITAYIGRLQSLRRATLSFAVMCRLLVRVGMKRATSSSHTPRGGMTTPLSVADCRVNTISEHPQAHGGSGKGLPLMETCEGMKGRTHQVRSPAGGSL